ncbi:Na+/H+ antiporter [Nakamurella lactea]|uniref:Na+/H+ antiporter n=1 Tax=Nakamurella lactea TaxID=459515 RepID=UPI00048CD318|nr:Na+/H+ antiporter [Nakamurella lactea]
MDIALAVGAMALTVVVFDQLARRLGISGPLLLMLVGIIGSFLPFIPDFHLDAEVVLLGLLPPLLYSTAIRTSVIDFRNNIRVIGYLSVLLVLVTAAVVGLVVWLILPVPFAVAFALGAVVAPPDAVAASAVARKVGLPRALVSILEGESLVNDATAITCLRAGIAAMAGATTINKIGASFLLALVGGIVIGVVIAAIATWVRRRITDPVADTAISFIIPWAAYVPAEAAHSSGVIAVVTAGLLLGHKSQVVQTAQSRMTERTNWTTVQFLLENTVFLLIGLQARWIIDDVARSGVTALTVIWCCAAVLITVIVVRMVWVTLGRFVLFRRRNGNGQDRPPLQWTLIIGWAGMRGVVTLAAAFLLPEDTPYRPVLELAALVVTAGTLILQGTTLPLLVRRLGVQGPNARQDALATATVLEVAGDRALAALDKLPDIDDDVREELATRIRQRSDRIWERLGAASPDETPADEYSRLRLYALGVERQTVLEMRNDGRVDQEVLGSVLATLDVEESMLAAVARRSASIDAEVIAEPIAQKSCEHLDKAPTGTEALSAGCLDCEREGTKPVHLRLCLNCGNVGCCDSSVGRHATRHFEQTDHPVMRSFEPGEKWRWCYLDRQLG